jgi:hypothetical protein
MKIGQLLWYGGLLVLFCVVLFLPNIAGCRQQHSSLTNDLTEAA